MIEVSNLCKRYGSCVALDNLSFQVKRGGVTGFLGPNGAGKSTTMRILTCFLRADSGSALVNGLEVSANPMLAKAAIGYLPENNPLHPELRVDEFLRFRARIKGVPGRDCRRAANEAASRCGLAGSEKRIIGQLSRGYRQRVGLADCLLAGAPLLILDEPTAGLDPNQARETRRLVAEIGEERTVFLSTHLLSEVEKVCQQVIIISKGKLVAVDTPEGLISRGGKQRALLMELLAPEREAREKLAAIAGVSSAEKTGRGIEGGLRWRLVCSSENDIRPKITAVCAENGWVLQEMRLEPVQLEDVFAELTQGAGEAGK